MTDIKLHSNIDDVKTSPVDRELSAIRAGIVAFALPALAVAWLADGLLRGALGAGGLVRRVVGRDAGI